MNRIVRLLFVGLLPLAGLAFAASTAVAWEQAPEISVSVQGCEATILNVPEGATTLITGTVGDQDFSTTDNPALLVTGSYTATVSLNGEQIFSSDFVIGEGCPPPSPSPSPEVSPSPSPTTVPCGSTASAARCPTPSPRTIPKPPTTGVGYNETPPVVWLLILAAVLGINGGLFLLARRRGV